MTEACSGGGREPSGGRREPAAAATQFGRRAAAPYLTDEATIARSAGLLLVLARELLELLLAHVGLGLLPLALALEFRAHESALLLGLCWHGYRSFRLASGRP